MPNKSGWTNNWISYVLFIVIGIPIMIQILVWAFNFSSTMGGIVLIAILFIVVRLIIRRFKKNWFG